MGPTRIRRSALALAAIATLQVSGARVARGTIETISEFAFVHIPAGGGTGVVTTHDFSVLAWIRPEDLGSDERSILEISGAFELRVGADGRLVARVLRGSGSPLALEATAPEALVLGEWALVAASFDRSTGELWVGSASESTAFDWSAASVAGFSPGPVNGDTYLGRSQEVLGVHGIYGLLALRRESITPGDAGAVWDSRRFHAPFDLDTTGAGGTMTGEANCWWMVNHTVATLPLSALVVPSNQNQRAAVVGFPVSIRNFAIFDRGSNYAQDDLSVVRPVLVADSCEYVSHHEGAAAGFFVRRLPTGVNLGEPSVAAVAPRAGARLVTGPVGPWKVMFSGNSRSSKRFDGSGWSPGNYAHGFAWLIPEMTSGVLNAPTPTATTPWFGLDTSANAPYTQGSVLTIGQMDFSRFWTGSVTNAGIGPGSGILMSPQAVYALRCRPEGLITAEAPLVLRTHVLCFPGSSALNWIANKNDRQGSPGIDVGVEQVFDPDTTLHEHVFTPANGDAYLSDGTLVLAGDVSAHAPVGRAVADLTAISVVSGVDFDVSNAGMTTIHLEHPLGVEPVDGTTLRFGPWRFETIEHVWPGLAPQDPDVWRGLKFESGPDGVGVVIFGMDAWRPDVDGFVWGVSGWGGNGYRTQIDASFSGAIEEWMRALSPDVWMQTFAQQYSMPATMSEWRAIVKDALPFVDVVWLGDMMHGTTFTPWHEYILQNGAPEGSPAISLLMHEELGDQLELFGDGLRADGNHVSQRGNERLAALWLEALADAALDPPLPGDANGDGEVGFDDLNHVLSDYGAAGQGMPGDVDFNNVVDFADLNVVLGSYGQASPSP